MDGCSTRAPPPTPTPQVPLWWTTPLRQPLKPNNPHMSHTYIRPPWHRDRPLHSHVLKRMTSSPERAHTRLPICCSCQWRLSFITHTGRDWEQSVFVSMLALGAWWYFNSRSKIPLFFLKRISGVRIFKFLTTLNSMTTRLQLQYGPLVTLVLPTQSDSLRNTKTSTTAVSYRIAKSKSLDCCVWLRHITLNVKDSV